MKRWTYIDTSALLALFFEEEGGARFRTVLRRSRASLVSASLLEAEVYAATKRENVPLEKATPFIEMVSLVFPDMSLQREYLRIYEQGYLRGADGCHLATALYLDPQCRHLSFVTADHQQAVIASALGFKVVSSH